jgi:hypothetical protein
VLSYINEQTVPYALEEHAASHLECLKGQVFLDYQALKMKALCFFETTVTIYQQAWHTILEDLNVWPHDYTLN